MKSLTALSVSIGALGAVATFLALGPLSFIFLIWAGFIGWAAFFVLGGNQQALKTVVISGIFGVVVAWLAAVIIINVPLASAVGLPVWGGLVVGVTAFVIVIAANFPTLAAIPMNVLGYAATFAYILQTSGKLDNSVLLGAGFDNPLITVSFSIALGAGFGLLSAKLGEKLTTKKPA